MFKIGAFSKLVHVSARMLHHYEKCGLLYPIKFDKANGNRYYSAAQIPLLHRITSLRDMGFNIAEIGDILDNYEDDAYVERMIAQKTKEVKEQMYEFQTRLSRLDAVSVSIDLGHHAQSVEVIRKPVPSYPVISLRKILPNYNEQNSLWQRLFSFIDEYNLDSVLSGQLLCIYHCEENEYEVIGCEQFYCLAHYLNCKDINQYQTEMQLPIKKL